MEIFWYVAPLLDAVEYEDVNFDNDFAHQTKYRGPPTKELEEEWSKLWLCMYTLSSSVKTSTRVRRDILDLYSRTLS